MKGYVETLEGGGYIVTDLELINYILDGLRPKYDIMVASLITRI